VTAPITLPRLDAATLTKLRQWYEETPNVESRTRYQMILLAQQEYKVPQIARMVLRSEDTVARVLNRFLAGGLDAVPRRSPPGRERRVTAAWEAELLRVIELDPHEVGQETANWTTELRASVLRPAHRHTGHRGNGARVLACAWLRLQAPDVDLTTQSGRASRLRGKRVRVEVLLAGTTGPEPLPVKDLLEVDLWSQLPADVPELLARLSRADLYAARMRCSLPFIRPSPGSGASMVGAANGSSKLQATIGRSTVLGWWTGAMGGLMAGLRQDEQLMSFATRCVRRWRVRRRGDV